MYSTVVENPWIGIGISNISHIDVSEEEANGFGYSNNLFELFESGTGNK